MNNIASPKPESSPNPREIRLQLLQEQLNVNAELRRLKMQLAIAKKMRVSKEEFIALTTKIDNLKSKTQRLQVKIAATEISYNGYKCESLAKNGGDFSRDRLERHRPLLL